MHCAMNRSVRGLAIALLAAAIVLPRLYLGLAGEPIFWNDSANYLEAARSLVATGVVEDSAYRTPGYPAFLAVCSWFGEMVHVAVLVQQLLGVLLAALVWDVARRVFASRWIAWAALAAYAVDLRFVVCAQTILTELLHTIVVVGGVWGLVVWRDSRSRTALALAAACAGVAPLVRPVAVLYGPLAALFVVGVRALEGARGWRAAGPALLVAAIALAPPASWVVRNGLRYGSWRLTPMHSPHLLERVIHLVDLENGPDAENRKLLAQIVGPQNWRLGAGLRLFHRLRERGLGVVEADAACGRFVRETVTARFGTYLAEIPWLLWANLRLASPHPDVRARAPSAPGELILKGWPTHGPALFTDAASVGEWLRRGMGKLAEVPVSTSLVHALTHTWLALTILALASAGAVRSMRAGADPAVLLIAGTIAYYCVLPTLTVPSSDRFRVPVEPLLIVLASRGLSPRGGRSPDS